GSAFFVELTDVLRFPGYAEGSPGQVGFWFALGVFGAVLLGAGSPWVPYTVARLWIALWGHLPWRLMRFLDDAHDRGILRQAGAVYQFRHARLQEHLAGEWAHFGPPRLIRWLVEARIRSSPQSHRSRRHSRRNAIVSTTAAVAILSTAITTIA